MNDKHLLLGACFAAVLSMMTAGCGGGDDGVSCGTFAACGGDLAGTWELAGLCGVEDLEPPEECPTATFSENIDQSGTITFGADNVYMENVTTTGSVSFTYPAACLEGVPSCDTIEMAVTGSSCTGTPTTSCSCTLPVDDTSTENGTYALSGNTVTTTTPSGSNVIEYCVDGSTLKAREQGQTAYVVLTK